MSGRRVEEDVMERRPLDEPTLFKIVHGMIRQLAAGQDVPVETQAGEMVSVQMDGQYRVTSVSIRGLELESAEIARLEAAVIEAVNGAIQEVAKRNAERLTMMAPDILAVPPTAAPESSY
jgi:DNA-binding protein YbaB